MPRGIPVSKKRVTRKLTGNSKVDSALKDIYNKIDKLQPALAKVQSPLLNQNANVGDIMLVQNNKGEDLVAVYTSTGWKIDINSKLLNVDGVSFKPTEGYDSSNLKVTKGEAILHDSKTAYSLNDVLRWDGEKFIPKQEGEFFDYTFSINTFSDGLNTQDVLMGTNPWKAADAITFSATYLNGPATTAYVQIYLNNTSPSTVSTFVSPYTTGKNIAINYPTLTTIASKNYRFKLYASNGSDNETQADGSIFTFKNKYYSGLWNSTEGSFEDSDAAALKSALTANWDVSSLSSISVSASGVNGDANNRFFVAIPERYGDADTEPTKYALAGTAGNEIICPISRLTAGGSDTESDFTIANANGFEEDFIVWASPADLGGSGAWNTASTINFKLQQNPMNRLYYGTHTDATPNAAEIKAMSHITSNDITRNWAVSSANYIVVAVPKRISGSGTLSFVLQPDGFNMPMNILDDDMDIQNINGKTEEYTVYVSNADQGGTTSTITSS